MKTVISVQPLSNYRLLLEFDNGEKRIGDISRACEYLELSGRADFAAAFTGNLSFPQP